MTTWDRLESMARSIALTPGLEVRVADPLWLLARQLQVAEFRGEDAGQPVIARIDGRSIALTVDRSPERPPRAPTAGARPLEKMIEAAPVPDDGAAGLFASARAASRLLRLLDQQDLGAAATGLRGAFAATMPDRLVAFGGAGGAAASLLVRHGFDVRRVATASRAALAAAISSSLPSGKVDAAVTVTAGWAAGYLAGDGAAGSTAWDDERLEYRFGLQAGAGGGKGASTVAAAAGRRARHGTSRVGRGRAAGSGASPGGGPAARRPRPGSR